MWKRLIAAVGVLAGIAAVSAQSFPSRPVTAVVPATAGGPTDTIGRIVMARAQQLLGQTIVIENVGGASGTIGTGRVVRAEPDGYTIGIGGVNHYVVNASVYPLAYDTLKDFEPVSMLSNGPMLIMSRNSIPAKNLQELIALSKSKSVNIGTSGAGSATHMTLARFNAATGANITHVPYRGGGALIPDLLSGAITGAMTELSTALPHVGGGRVRVLGVAWNKRSPQMADVPTMIEQGVTDFTAASYVGILAPAATPGEIVKTLETALIKALNGKDLQQKMLASGAELVPDDLMTSQGFAAYIKKEYDLTREAAKIAGLTPT